ncbi:MAG: four helix bundle protein [Chitinispirillaceae bacterium]|nr:four helix bundle protein [Chitinispirillaceae bacterium]
MKLHRSPDDSRAIFNYLKSDGRSGTGSASESASKDNYANGIQTAEGNGKATDGDRRRYFEIARGSALECSAVQDVLQLCGTMSAEENVRAKIILDQVVVMLTRLGKRGYCIHEDSMDYTTKRNDTEADADPDPDAM